jgi:arylformamidase
MTDYRASFDAAITFSNGGDLTAHGFRVDAPSPDIDENGIAALFVASLGLLMTDSVTLANVGRRITVADGRPQAAGSLNAFPRG